MFQFNCTRSLLLFLLVLLFSNKVSSSDSLASTTKQYEHEFTRNFDYIYSLSRKFSSKYALPFYDKLVKDLNISSVCANTLRTMVLHPEREWSSLMLDSSGHLIRPGFLSGTITDYGDYDQCMSIRGYTDATLVASNVAITGRYCLLTIRPPIPPHEVVLNYSDTKYQDSWPSRRFATPYYRFYWRITSGLCFPTLCHESEVERVLQKALEGFNLHEVSVGTCQAADDLPKLDFAQILSIVILGSCASAVVIGTLVDYRKSYTANRRKKYQNVANQESKQLDAKYLLERQQRRAAAEFWISFSLLRNSQTLFSINDASSANSKGTELTSIHGLRVLLILWVILCHTTNFAPLGLYDQPSIAARFGADIKIVREFLTQFVISGSLSVTAFFVISGLISLHTSLKNKEDFQRNVPYWKYMLLRWLRFSPPLLGMFCYQFVWPLLGSGPIMHWDFLKYGHQPCYSSWWANFAFVSNWLPLVEQCGSHTWFLSADFQINLFAYFIIWAYTKDYNLGLRLNWIAFGISSVAPTFIHWYYSVPLVHIMEPDINKLNVAFNMIEFNTYNHFSAYFAGLLVAGLLNSEVEITFSKSLRYSLWWFAMAIVTLIPFSTYPFIQMEEIPANFAALAYTGVKRFLFTSAIAWIIFATSSCSKRGMASQILSARIFQPFSRLTFCIYLTQSLVVWYFAYSNRALHFISHYNTIFRVGGVALYSLVFAFILYALFEAPSVNLCKLALKRYKLVAKPVKVGADLNNNNTSNGELDTKKSANKVEEEKKQLMNDKSSNRDDVCIEIVAK